MNHGTTSLWTVGSTYRALTTALFYIVETPNDEYTPMRLHSAISAASLNEAELMNRAYTMLRRATEPSWDGNPATAPQIRDRIEAYGTARALLADAAKVALLEWLHDAEEMDRQTEMSEPLAQPGSIERIHRDHINELREKHVRA